jgi:hypothetical protein
VAELWAQYRNELASDPLLILALSSALVALATTPLAFAVLGRLEWFKARRGRVLQRPAFSSIVVGMMLAMGIPAIFAALVIKSRSFDHNRYEFDPNRTWSVLEQGRRFQSVQEADAAVVAEMDRLALERKNLVEKVKKLDEAMVGLRRVAGTSPAVAQQLPSVLQSLAGVRKSIGLDGPQQLLDSTAPPVELRSVAAGTGTPTISFGTMPAPGTAATAAQPISAAVATPSGNGLSPTQTAAELASVPEPQRAIAAMLPFSDLPPEWTLGKSGDRHLETFNADNLYEKIDGRAESFIQYGVKGMAYTFYHPTGDPSNELQLYVFEMGDSLKALGKYGSEKPEEFQSVAVGDEGYTSAGSTLFYVGRYYTQIVSTQDDPKFAAFALELARRVAASQKPGGAAAPPASGRETPSPPVSVAATQPATSPTTSPAGVSHATAAPEPAASPFKPETAEVSPAAFFALLPSQGRHGDPKYVPQDVFGYSFLSDVFMADYRDRDVTWQGFVRPCRDAQEANGVLEKYKAGVKQDGGEVKMLAAPGADEMIVCNNTGLVDVVFRKGNAVAGANGATSAPPAEAFARALAKSLPATVPTLGNRP